MSRFTNSFYRYIQPFHFRSIFFKYLKQFTLISVIPFLLLSMLVYLSQVQYSKVTSNDAFKRLSGTVSETLNHTILQTEQIYTDLKYATNDYFLSTDTEDMYTIYKTSEYIKRAVADGGNIHSVYMYRFSEDTILSTVGKADIHHRDFKDILNHYRKSNATNFVLHTKSYDVATKKDTDILSFCYGVYSRSNCHGMIVINYDFKTLDTIVASNNGEEFFILDETERVAYSNNTSLVGTKLSDTYAYDLSKGGNLVSKINYASISSPLMSKGMNFVSIYQYDYAGESNPRLRTTLILSVTGSILLALFLSFYVSYSFYKSITEIINGFSVIKTDEVSDNITNEIKYINHQTSKIIDKNLNFERELSEKMAQIKTLQLTASQFQFNHHFLFNTLNLIAVLAHNMTKEDNDVTKSISLLSELLRISLDTDQYTTSIGAEILYAKKYIELEQLKYENIFNVEWNISPEISNYRIIKLILQPIIENAFMHALRPMPKDYEKKLTISAAPMDNKIIFHIIDNGKGFDTKKLAEIRKSLETPSFNKSKHIGLANVNNRIKLLFGESCGIYIHPLDVGTDIEIVIQKIDFSL